MSRLAESGDTDTGGASKSSSCINLLDFILLDVCEVKCLARRELDEILVAGMRGKLPDSIKLPPSVTVPFGAFEEALNQRENKDVKKRLEAAVKAIPESHAEERLQECRDIVMEVRTGYSLRTFKSMHQSSTYS